MARKIDSYSFRELITRFGIPAMFMDLRATYRLGVDDDEVAELEDLIYNARNYDEIKRILISSEDMFDKEQYLFTLVRLIELDIENLKKTMFLNGQSYQKRVSNPAFVGMDVTDVIKAGKEMLKEVDVADVIWDGEKGDIQIDLSQKYVGNDKLISSRFEKGKERLKEIDKELGFYEMFNFLRPSDMIQLCRYPNLGNAFAVKLNRSRLADSTIEQYHDRVNGKIKDVDDSLDQTAGVFDWDDFEDTIKSNPGFWDFDKMLLLSNAVYFNKHGNQFEDFTYDDMMALREYTAKVEKLLGKANPKLRSPRFNNITIDKRMIKDSVENLYNHFVNGYYRSDLEIEDMIRDILDGHVSIREINPDDAKRVLKFTQNELLSLVRLNGENFKYFVEKGFIIDRNIQRFVDMQREFKKEQLAYMVDEKIIEPTSVVDYYMDDRVTLDTIEEISSSDKDLFEKIQGAISKEKLVELYLDQEKQEDFDKYRRLYKRFVVDKIQDTAKKKEEADSLLETSDELLDDSRLLELYHYGIIPVDTLIEFVGEAALESLYAANEIKPLEAHRLFTENVISMDMLKNILADNDIEDTEKLVLIYSTFPDKEDAAVREELIQYLDEIEENKNPNKPKKKKTTDELYEDLLNSPTRNGGGLSENRYVTDPCARWKLIASIDPDYSQEYLRDGHIVFYLPNQEKYILEKLYDKNKRPAMNAATYIIDEKTFRDNEEEILANRVVQKPVLTSLRQNPQVTSGIKRVIHTGWGEGIARTFDLYNESKYTKEEIAKRKELVKEIEDSKTRVDDRY